MFVVVAGLAPGHGATLGVATGSPTAHAAKLHGAVAATDATTGGATDGVNITVMTTTAAPAPHDTHGSYW